MSRLDRIFRRGCVRWSSAGLAATLGLLLIIAALPPATATSPDADPAPAPATPPAAADEPVAQDAADEEDGWFDTPEPRTARPPLPAEITNAFVIPVEGAIGMTTADVIRRKVVQTIAQGAELVVFEFDTPGGRIDAADIIAKLIHQELRGIRTVAFVNTDAISAGAWLALNCHEIVMVPRGKIGDAAPVTMHGELQEVEREKIESYLRSDFRNAAEANGYWPIIVESMVSADLEVWLIRNEATGELRYVERGEWAHRVEGAPGETTPSDAAGADPAGEWHFVRVVVPEGRLLTATTTEAVELGLAKAVVQDFEELKSLYNVTAAPTVLADTWSERLAMFLTSPAITGLLIMMAMFFGYIELNTPGFGLGGTLAIICLALLFGSRFITGLAHWWEITVFVLGVVLLLVEIFVLPGFGVFGVLGIVLCIVGLLAILIANPPDEFPIPSPGLVMDKFLDALFALAVGFLAGLALCLIAARYLPKIPYAGRLVLADVPTGDSLPTDAQAPIRRIQPGQRGVTETYCRPVGRARFGEDLIDVVTDGRFVPAGTTVVVQRNEGNRLLVEPVEADA